MSVSDRRHEPRVQTINLVHLREYRYPTLIDYKTDDTLGKTLDLSHDGMRLEVDHALPLRTKVKLDLALGEQILTMMGKVRSLSEIDETHVDLGIEFENVTPEQYEALEEYLQLRAPDA